MNMIMLLLINLVLCVIVANMGKQRKFGFWGYLFASLLFTPVIGLFLVLASDAPPPAESEKNSSQS